MILIASLIVLLLPAFYVGTYLALVKPATFSRREIWPVYIWGETPVGGQEFWKSLFAPAHWADLRIRARLWKPAKPEEFRGRVYFRPGVTSRDELQ